LREERTGIDMRDMGIGLLDMRAKRPDHADHAADIRDSGQIAQGERRFAQQRGGKRRQAGILGAGDRDSTPQGPATGNPKAIHPASCLHGLKPCEILQHEETALVTG